MPGLIKHFLHITSRMSPDCELDFDRLPKSSAFSQFDLACKNVKRLVNTSLFVGFGRVFCRQIIAVGKTLPLRRELPGQERLRPIE